MNCDKLQKIYNKSCEESVRCKNMTYGIAEEIQTMNCLVSMQLLAKHCTNKIAPINADTSVNTLIKNVNNKSANMSKYINKDYCYYFP